MRVVGDGRVTTPRFVRLSTEHLDGSVRLCAAEGWRSFPDDPGRAARVLAAPGVTTVVAISDDRVVGFAEVFSDGELQAYLANLVVDRGLRGQGIGRSLVVEAFTLAGGERVDLPGEEEAAPFYENFPHFRKPGYRLYPSFTGPEVNGGHVPRCPAS